MSVNSTHYLVAILASMILIGVLANIINLVIFGQKSMRKTPTFRLLAYLSIIDLLVLIICTSDLLLTFNFKIQIRLFSSLSCRLHTFFTGYLTQLSSVLLMIVSMERAFLIYNKKLICFQINQIESLVLIIMIILALLNTHYLYYFNLNINYEQITFTDTVNYSTGTKDINSLIFYLKETKNLNEINYTYRYSFLNQSFKHYKFQNNSLNESILLKKTTTFGCYQWNNTSYGHFFLHIWNWIDALIYSYVPIFVMAICSFLILKEVNKKGRRLSTNPIFGNRRFTKNRIKRSNQILLMLVSTNLFFIICSIPYCISHYNISFERTETDKSHSLYLVHTLAYSNNSFNIIFYIIFSERFRKELIKVFNLDAKYSIPKLYKHKKQVSDFDNSLSRNNSFNEQISMKVLSKEPKNLFVN